jgi:signal transduction histidine kinase
MSRSLTQRVRWALMGVVALFVGVLGVLAFLSFGRMEDGLVDKVLRYETERLLNDWQSGKVVMLDGEILGLDDALRAWYVGEAEPALLPSVLQRLSAGSVKLTLGGGRVWHVRSTVFSEGRQLIVVYDATDNEQRVYDFGLIVLLLGAVCIALAHALAHRLAQHVVAPVHAVTRRLAHWAPDALLASQAGDEDEAARLIEAFEHVRQRVDHRMAAEREFSANLSHEIRTPLSALRSDSELMLLCPGLPDDVQTRLRRVVNNVDTVAAILKTVRQATLDKPRMPRPVDVREALEAAWLSVSLRAHAAGLDWRNTVAPLAIVVLDSDALMTVFLNLMRNAIEHAAPARLTASMDAAGLHFIDTGPGIDPAEMPFVFERYYHGARRDSLAKLSQGGERRGLGLAIAKRVCDLQGWSLSVAAAGQRETGVVFTLGL